MKKSEAVNFFGSQKELAVACGVSPQAVSLWPGEHIPMGHQYRLQIATNGQLKAEPVKPKKVG